MYIFSAEAFYQAMQLLCMKIKNLFFFWGGGGGDCFCCLGLNFFSFLFSFAEKALFCSVPVNGIICVYIFCG